MPSDITVESLKAIDFEVLSTDADYTMLEYKRKPDIHAMVPTSGDPVMFFEKEQFVPPTFAPQTISDLQNIFRSNGILGLQHQQKVDS